MKAYTDLEQSKKLAEILPLESADMHYNNVSIKGINYVDEHRAELMEYNRAIKVLSKYTINPLFEVIPCWSLAALLGLMPFHIIENNNRFGFYQVKGFNKQGETYRFGYKTNNDSFLFETSWYNDVIDAAFEMIVWLKENNKI